MPILHGVPLSPFVRKVLIALAEKSIEFENEPVVPFGQTPEYRAKSPLGKIPCWEDGDVVIPDSSVIIDYLENTHPTPALYPADPVERAAALFLEEYSDSKLVEGLTTVFFQRFVAPNFFKEEPDQAKIDEALNETLPPLFDYLEGRVGDREVLVGEHFSIADIAVTSPFVNHVMVGESVDADRWPKLAGYLERQFARPSIKPIVEAALAAG